MSMSTHVVGIKPPDYRWHEMKAVWDACKAANVQPPKAVLDFFGGEEPDPDGVVVEIENSLCCTSHEESGFDVDVTKLPKDVKIIRFRNSW